MPNHRNFLPLACLLLACTLSPAIAMDLPAAPDDPQSRDSLQQARVMFERTQTASFLDMPAQAQPWPCAVSELQLRRWTSPMALGDDEIDEKSSKIQAKIVRGAGMGRGEMKTSIGDVRHAPIVASCKDGKLDGVLEFVIEFTRSTDMPTMRMDMRMRTRVHVQVAAGESNPSAGQSTASIQLSQRNTFKDPATQALMQKNPAPELKLILATHSVAVGSDPSNGYSATITQTRIGNGPAEWSTLLTQPTGPTSMVTTMYVGSKVWNVTRTRNGLPHGEMKTYPIVKAGLQMPGSTRCYENGEEIKTAQCDVQ